jgi:molybdopterin molybdotransferase
MVNYELFVRPILAKLSGAKALYHRPIQTTLREDLTLRKGKYTVLLGDFDGTSFNPFSKQQAGMLSPLIQANGMIITRPEVDFLAKGTSVKMIPLKGEMYGDVVEELFSF